MMHREIGARRSVGQLLAAQASGNPCSTGCRAMHPSLPQEEPGSSTKRPLQGLLGCIGGEEGGFGVAADKLIPLFEGTAEAVRQGRCMPQLMRLKGDRLTTAAQAGQKYQCGLSLSYWVPPPGVHTVCLHMTASFMHRASVSCSASSLVPENPRRSL